MVSRSPTKVLGKVCNVSYDVSQKLIEILNRVLETAFVDTLLNKVDVFLISLEHLKKHDQTR